MAFVLDEEMQNVTNIKVIGVGGGGGNAVNRMVEAGLNGVEFVAMNTDQQALVNSKATQKVQLGAKLTKGRGAGADPEVGQRAAEESKDEIANALKGAQMVFITAGMGGGTGTGAAPVVAETAHDLGILTVGIVTKPFAFEGKRKMSMAEQGIANLMMHVDSLIVIPNERLKLISQEKITLMNAFQAADDVLNKLAVKDIDKGKVAYARRRTDIDLAGTYEGIRIDKAALHIVNGQRGVYVKYGNLQRFLKITTLYENDSYILVPEDGKLGSANEVRLYDEIIVQGTNLEDGKLL